MPKRPDPVSPADDQAIALARSLLDIGHASLAYIDAVTQTPGISRIAFGLAPDGMPMTLISALAPHFDGLKAQPACALMFGEPGEKGDPLTHPRLMLRAKARFVLPNDAARPDLRAHWLEIHPKAKLYIDFSDFALVLLEPEAALLNAGFGRAFGLTPEQLLK
ncbi:pyridoxamine 5-phosphate oxidase [Thioclava sp. FR2]|uniref:pyridoxamine 5-phosphate oxidase n=1 Tax=Thioclava sp. FR2 TaxID=3445780 RepID=UPI003EBA0200